ncbi:MAG: hypothetical protein GEU91_00605 [Rhizobiales bacterium]|nr:hypothetical protein [Hyphomicrobiales bacterium]
MSSPNSVASPDGADATALRAACALIVAARSAEGLGDGDIQVLFGAAVRLYAQRAAERDEPLAAFVAEEAGITATDAMLATTAILKAVNVATFELGMWQAWTRG